jgi:uncharacterized protein (DUF58 family)
MRAGWFYLALTVSMGFAGINTGNNLIYLTCGLMLGVIVASGLLSERCLRGLEIERQLPEAAVCGRPMLVGLSLRNTKRSTSFGLLVEDLESGGRCQYPLVPPGELDHRSYTQTPIHRGRLSLLALRVATRFPFGLFEKSLRLERPAELLIHPAPLPCPIPPEARDRLGGEVPAGLAGEGQDPWQLRLYRDGEDSRAISWAASARSGRLVALDRERSERRRAHLELPTTAEPEAFEREVGHAAFLAEALMNEGLSVSLRQGALPLVEDGFGPTHLRRLLDALAECEPLELQ